ncbi:AlpA family transcriptional regulator [Bradyrhizobium sp. 186]|uniref:helix-turn-helix transcriptional regulator n=1 Tax=Bradyrhizobium sp. 186 TaxID=2782654 RepID=UPI0020012D54|nr:AlpA family phage regulatory protein [Bradyrhizobium sp. 186]UPK31877.1 AlpA family transcriptional regulator [Bradyrhizobium sp. 186]UPK36769.1 AlpA family transcriptional regulator [Bradyrhizobium sp. 186]
MIAAARPGAEPGDATDEKSEPQRMLAEAELLKLVPISRATLFRLMREGKFPRGTFISQNRRVWLASEVARWQREVNAYDPRRRRGKGRGRCLTPS